MLNQDNLIKNLMKAAAVLGDDRKPLLKFDHGKYVFGTDKKEEVPIGTKLETDLFRASWGFVRWERGKPVERRVVEVGGGTKPPSREELGDDDKEVWEPGAGGAPKDPWQKTFELPVKEIGGEEREFLLSGSSRGFEIAFGSFVKNASRQVGSHIGEVPVIELGASTFSTKLHGRVACPEFKIVDWVKPSLGGAEDDDDGDDLAEDLNDDIPF